MASLFPVMSSMFITVHVPVVSGAHATVHCAPSLYTSPGAGVLGVGSARTKAAPRTRVARTAEVLYMMCSLNQTDNLRTPASRVSVRNAERRGRAL